VPAIAILIDADVDECILIPNANHGVNTVLRNLDWKKGDVIVKSTDFELAAAEARCVTEVCCSL
jgi:selenocysteine lyase/cysteine desulfurase